MNNERLQEVLKILSRYDNKQEVVDYYELFGFNKNATLEEIKAQIKSMRLQVLFHPDQINYVPNEYHEKYLEVIKLATNAINVFDSYRNKEAYDQKLKVASQANNSHNYNYSSNNAHSYSSNNNSYNYNQRSNNNYSSNNANSYHSNTANNKSYNNNNYSYNNNNNKTYNDENKTEDLHPVYLQQAIITNAQKYGFEFAMQALKEIIEKNYFGGFTRTDNARDIVAHIGRDKIMELVSKASINDNNVDLDQILMNYFSDIMYKNPILRQQINYVEQACVKTLYNYDLTGVFGQTRTALNDYVQYGNASHFTNTDNARVNLINNVKQQDVPFIVKCSLNSRRHENEYFSYTNLKNMSGPQVSTIYVDDLYGRMRRNEYHSNNQYDGNGEYSGNNGFGR